MAGAVAALLTLLWRSGAGVAFAAAAVAGLAQQDVLDVEPGWWIAAALVGGLLVAGYDRSGEGRDRTAAGPVLLAVTVFGCWVTVPETQHVVVLVGAVLPVAAVSFLRPTRLGVPGAFAAVAVIAWVVEVDGRARAGAVVGALACLGLMALAPVLRRVVPGWEAFVVHAVLVAWCSRVAGMQDGAVPAVALVAVGYVVAGVVVARMRTGVRAAAT